MKIRKLKLSNYKIFDNIELDFTDENKNTLNTIIFAGINGTGKTTLLELFIKLIYNEKPFELEKQIPFIELEVELTNEELKDFKEYIDEHIDIDDDLKYIEIKDNLVNVWRDYESNVDSISGFQKILEYNYRISEISDFKVCYFYDHLYNTESEKKSFLKMTNFDFFYGNLEKYFKKIITDQVLTKRDVTGGELIKKFIADINNILSGIELNTKIIDIVDYKLVFESINGQKIEFTELSAGEKQIYYRAIYLNALNLENSIILVDEPELSLHPAWQNNVVRLYQNIGKNNQVFISTHSPHIIGSVSPESLFLLKPENDNIVVKQPKYSVGHSIPYVLSEIMEVDYRNTETNKIVDSFLELLRQEKHETKEGKQLLGKIMALDSESEERMLVELSLERYNVIGK